MTNPEVAAVAERLAEAQREALRVGQWNADPICADLMMAGLIKKVPTVSWPYYVELSEIGTAVRSYLLSQEAGEVSGG